MQECLKDSILQEDLDFVAKEKSIPWDCLDNCSILVTGATGLIGSQLVKSILCRNRLFEKNIKIYAAVRSIEKARSVFSDFFNDELF